MSKPASQPIAATILVVLSLIAAYGYFLNDHVRNLWSKEYYQHFPFIIGAIIFLVGNRCCPTEESHIKKYGAVFYFLMAISTLALLGASIVNSPWVGAFSMILLFGAALWELNRRWPIQNALGIWMLSLLLLPLPFNLDRDLIQRLQLVSAQFSSQCLDWLKIPHVMSGVILQLTQKELFVDEACSGIVSLISITACGAILAVWKNRAGLHSICLLGSGLVWATLMNTVRICLIGVALHKWNIDLSEGWMHDVLGLTLFLGTFLLLLSTDLLLEVFLGTIPNDSQSVFVRLWNFVVNWFRPAYPSDISGQRIGLLTLRPSWRLALSVSVPLLTIAAAQAALLATKPQRTKTASEIASSAAALDDSFLPAELNGWQKTSFEHVTRGSSNTNGENSLEFEFTKQGLTAMISFDFPFAEEWHELSVCYRNSGWNISEREIISSTDQIDHAHVAAAMKQPGMTGLLLFTCVEGTGNLIEPHEQFGDLGLIRLRTQLLSKISKSGLFQAQCFSRKSGEFSAEERHEIEALYQAE